MREILNGRRTALVALLLAALALAGSFAATALPAGDSATVSAFTITCRDASIAPKQANATGGQIVIAFRNRGTKAMRLRAAGRRTAVVGPGKSATLIIANLRPGTYKTACTVGGAVSPARSGTLVVKRAPAETTETTEG